MELKYRLKEKARLERVIKILNRRGKDTTEYKLQLERLINGDI